MFSLLSIVYVVIGILTIAYLFIRNRFSYWKNRGVPYLEPSFPAGSLKDVGKSKHIIEVLNEFYFSYKDKSPFVGGWFAIQPTLFVNDLDLIKTILIKDFNQFQDRSTYCNEVIDPLTGNLFNVHGERWRTLRHKLSPTFTSGKMKFMYPTVIEVTNRFIDYMNGLAEKNCEVEIKDLLARYTTDIIGSVAFGIECNSIKDPNADYLVYGTKVFNEQRHGKILMEVLASWPELGKILRMKQYPDSVIDFFLNIVRETVEYREKNGIQKNDFMNMLIEMKNETRPNAPKLNLMEVTAQAFVFFLGGFETSSSTMNFALYELVMNEELQEKARQHVNEVLEKHNGEFTYEAVKDLTYINQILSETLRKYPVLSYLTRKADQDYKIPGTDQIIEKGVPIMIPAYSIHNDPDIYPNPDVFDPDRFTLEEIGRRHPMSYLGFGDGPRNCIGMRFGQIQSKLGIAVLLKNFHFKMSPKTKVPMKFDTTTFLLASQEPIYLTMEKI